jgi:predicted HicB family RNase H-like nuclease
MKNYTYRAHWSKRSGDYEGVCLEFPLESAHAPSAPDAIAGVVKKVSELVAEYEREDTDPPASITDRDYSGTFVVRTSSALHARLMTESAEQGVSLNQWVIQKLAERKAVIDPFF